MANLAREQLRPDIYETITIFNNASSEKVVDTMTNGVYGILVMAINKCHPEPNCATFLPEGMWQRGIENSEIVAFGLSSIKALSIQCHNCYSVKDPVIIGHSKLYEIWASDIGGWKCVNLCDECSKIEANKI